MSSSQPLIVNKMVQKPVVLQRVLERGGFYLYAFHWRRCDSEQSPMQLLRKITMVFLTFLNERMKLSEKAASNIKGNKQHATSNLDSERFKLVNLSESRLLAACYLFPLMFEAAFSNKFIRSFKNVKKKHCDFP